MTDDTEPGKIVRLPTADASRPHTELEIPEATVSIATVTVSKKRLTKSVFHQVVTELIWSWDQEVIKGSGIGWVNDGPELGPDRRIHLLWERSGNLRRCYVSRTADHYRVKNRDAFLRGAVGTDRYARYKVEITRWLSTPTGSWGPKVDETRDFSPDEDPFPGYTFPDAAELWKRKRDEAKKKAEAATEAYIADVRLRYENLIEKWERCYDRYEIAVAPLFKLPQLYL